MLLAGIQRTVIYDRGRGIGIIQTQKIEWFKWFNDIKYVVGEWTGLFGSAEPDRYTCMKKVLDDVGLTGDYADTVCNS